MAVLVRMSVRRFARVLVVIIIVMMVMMIMMMIMIGAMIVHVLMTVIGVVIVVVTMTMRVDPTRAHRATSVVSESMRPTAMAAPNPLSIFTTVMPEAQLVSIPNSAAKPERAVP